MRAGNAALFMFVLLPHGLARRVPETVLAGTGTLHRWMIDFMRRRELLSFTLPAQGKEAAARSPLSLGFLC